MPINYQKHMGWLLGQKVGKDENREKAATGDTNLLIVQSKKGGKSLFLFFLRKELLPA